MAAVPSRAEWNRLCIRLEAGSKPEPYATIPVIAAGLKSITCIKSLKFEKVMRVVFRGHPACRLYGK